MTHRFVAPAILGIVALAFLAGCAGQSTLAVDPCVAESLPDLSSLGETGREVYDEVDTMPTIIGGLPSVLARLKYPSSARRAGVDGRVVVHFIVNKQGRVEDAIVTECRGGGLDEEALRVIRRTRFTPGMQDGEPVLVRMALPLTFRMHSGRYF